MPTLMSVSAPLRRSRVKSAHPTGADRGFALIDAALATALASVASLALLAVSNSMTTQARRAGTSVRARTVASELAERAAAADCGVQTGAEPTGDLQTAATRCDTVLGATLDGVVGDTTFTVTSGNVTYDVTVLHRWLRRADGGADAATCAALATAAPVAIERSITVTPVNGTGATSTAIDAVPADGPAYAPSNGAIVVSGLTAGDAVELQSSTPGSVRVRRTATLLTGGEGCVWFPFLPDGEFLVGRVGKPTTSVTVADGEVATITGGELPSA